jgi:hypothetical protein
MRRFSMLIWPIFFAPAICFAATPPAMEPIEEFLAENVGSDSGGVEVYVGLRCYSLFRVMSIYAKDNNLNEEAERFSEASNTFLQVAENSQNPKNMKYLVSQIKFMIEGYTERFLQSKALTGNFSEDSVIKADMAFCSSLTHEG